MIVAGSALVAQSPLHALNSVPATAHLRLPATYVATAPFSALLDALSLMSLRQHVATIVTIAGVFLLVRAARRLRGGRSSRHRELAASASCVIGLIVLYTCLTVLPRPMAAIALEEPGEAAVDFHSHTSASHDGNPLFGVHQNRAWHQAAGFNAAYVSDHATYAAAVAAAPANPSRAGDGTTLLPALELRCQGEHLILLGSRRPERSSCDESTLSESGVVAILTLPGRISAATPMTGIAAMEVADGAPRALDQMARAHSMLAGIVRERGIATVASSNDHGWSHTAAAWSIVPIAGWRTLGPASLDSAIQARVALGDASGIHVVERRRVPPPARLTGLALTVPAVVWLTLRTFTTGERLSSIAWIWTFWLVVLLRRRGRARRVSANA